MTVLDPPNTPCLI